MINYFKALTSFITSNKVILIFDKNKSSKYEKFTLLKTQSLYVIAFDTVFLFSRKDLPLLKH